jgi:hypothetical protein
MRLVHSPGFSSEASGWDTAFALAPVSLAGVPQRHG